MKKSIERLLGSAPFCREKFEPLRVRENKSLSTRTKTHKINVQKATSSRSSRNRAKRPEKVRRVFFACMCVFICASHICRRLVGSFTLAHKLRADGRNASPGLRSGCLCVRVYMHCDEPVRAVSDNPAHYTVNLFICKTNSTQFA